MQPRRTAVQTARDALNRGEYITLRSYPFQDRDQHGAPYKETRYAVEIDYSESSAEPPDASHTLDEIGFDELRSLKSDPAHRDLITVEVE